MPSEKSRSPLFWGLRMRHSVTWPSPARERAKEFQASKRKMTELIVSYFPCPGREGQNLFRARLVGAVTDARRVLSRGLTWCNTSMRAAVGRAGRAALRLRKAIYPQVLIVKQRGKMGSVLTVKSGMLSAMEGADLAESTRAKHVERGKARRWGGAPLGRRPGGHGLCV